ncbi:DUF6493 family protein [Chryseobacterium sp. IT-36CA2]|uniref:DUF7825 domain-containing protein n=1 Tax=Chryseobacterium sp. IT-36CA2 TaxID=3026460 RepID=UPI0039DF41A2
MFVDEGFEVIYLNYKINGTTPFLKKLTPEDIIEVVVHLKKHSNKKLRHNITSVFPSLVGSRAGSEYKDRSVHNVVLAFFADNFFESYHPQNTSFLTSLFNHYHSVYYNRLIKILFWRPFFSGSFFKKENNKILLHVVYQCDIDDKVGFSEACIKLSFSSWQRSDLFLFPGLFNNSETLYGTAFEGLLNKAVSDDLKVNVLGTIIGKKTILEWSFVMRLRDKILKLIDLTTSYTTIFEKLLIPILSAVEKSVFNAKKLPELYYKL